MQSEVAILSPEKVILDFRLASIGNRLLAQLLDLLLIAVLIIGEVLFAGWMSSVGLTAIAFLIQVSFIPTGFLYFILLEGFWNGQTLGKRALGLRVRMADATPITPMAAVGRNLLRLADFLPGFYFVGLVCTALTPKSQRFGDLAAGTCVFYERRTIPEFRTTGTVDGVHPLEPYIGDLPGMTQEDSLVLRQLADRFGEYAPAVQDRLLQSVWRPIATRLAIPAIPNVHPIYLMQAAVAKFEKQAIGSRRTGNGVDH